MQLSAPKTQNAATLYMLINKRSATSIDLRNFTSSSYPPARIQNLKDMGLSIITSLEKHRTKQGRNIAIARYTLATPMKNAKELYEKMNVCENELS